MFFSVNAGPEVICLITQVQISDFPAALNLSEQILAVEPDNAMILEYRRSLELLIEGTSSIENYEHSSSLLLK